MQGETDSWPLYLFKELPLTSAFLLSSLEMALSLPSVLLMLLAAPFPTAVIQGMCQLHCSSLSDSLLCLFSPVQFESSSPTVPF